jgi:hypothetical protein
VPGANVLVTHVTGTTPVTTSPDTASAAGGCGIQPIGVSVLCREVQIDCVDIDVSKCLQAKILEPEIFDTGYWHSS